MIEYSQIIRGLNLRPEIGFFGYSTVVLIKDGDENILVDTGGYGVREYLVDFAKRINIHKIFITHLHFDHCANINLFKNVPIYIHKDEIAQLTSDNGIYSDLYTFIAKSIEELKIVPFSEEANLSNNTKIKFTHGHTVGHSSLEIINQDKKIIVAGDALETYREYLNPNYSGTHFDKIAYKKSVDFIKNNYDIIIPGHDSIIEGGKQKNFMRPLKIF
jgi:N-acyl homoserine lactone hydrolase